MKNSVSVVLILITVMITSVLVWSFKPTNCDENFNPINVGAVPVQFTPQELQVFKGIKDSIVINNTDPDFPGERKLQWISMRNSTSAPWDPQQKSMEFLCFWSGRGANGEWEAVVSIYNAPGSVSEYVVEVARFTWHSLEVTLDGVVKARFPQVTEDTMSLGYTRFRIQV